MAGRGGLGALGAIADYYRRGTQHEIWDHELYAEDDHISYPGRVERDRESQRPKKKKRQHERKRNIQKRASFEFPTLAGDVFYPFPPNCP